MQSIAPKGKPRDVIYWGSCVTRDSEDFFPKGALTRRRYIARQSLCSVGHPVGSEPWLKSLTPLDSQFQQRMLSDDLAGNAIQRIRQVLAKFPDSVLLMDLVDERGGFLQCSNGAVITNSLEAIASGVPQAIPSDWVRKEITSLDFFLDFTEAAAAVAQALQEIGIWDRTYVIKARWADRSIGGEPTPPSFGLTAADANDTYGDLYAMLEEAGWKTLDPGMEPLVDSAHKWGLAPFHYADSYYQAIVEAVLSVLSIPEGG